MKQMIKRIAGLICAIAFCVFAVNAQASGDKLYNQGLALQKTMTVAAQNQAISKFQSAKKLYDSQAKKNQCDAAISVSRGIISNLKSGGNGGGGGKNTGGKGGGKQHQEKVKDSGPAPTLSLSNQRLHLGQEAGQMDVTVTTNQKEWSVAPVANSDGSSFINVEKVGENSFRVTVPFNGKSSPRTQYVQVSAGTATAKFEVSQAGREIELYASKNAINCGKKGGGKKVDIYCNADEAYPDNYNENWKVAECPDWVSIVPEVRQDKTELGRIVDKGMGAVTGLFGKNKGEEDPTMIKSTVSIEFDKMPGNISNRKGEIVFESGYKQYRMVVTQK